MTEKTGLRDAKPY